MIFCTLDSSICAPSCPNAKSCTVIKKTTAHPTLLDIIIMVYSILCHEHSHPYKTPDGCVHSSVFILSISQILKVPNEHDRTVPFDSTRPQHQIGRAHV